MSVLESVQVLKLNKGYTPIQIISGKEAFIDVFTEKAEIISVEDSNYISYDFNSWAEISQLRLELGEHEENDEWIFTSHLTLQVPRVIRSLTYENIPEYKVKFNRRNIYSRDGYTCQYCGKKLPASLLNIDHVIPKSKGGKNTWKNLVCSCLKCNNHKANNLLKEVGMKLIKIPREPKYGAQFTVRIQHEKYITWRHFISEAYWTIALQED